MTILKDIIDWVESKPQFWQVATDRLIRNNELTDNDIIELKEICKVDYGLSDFDFDEVDINELRNFANNSITSDNVILSKIFNVSNVNALSKTSELEFAPKGLTVVYGDNGSGKSSYVSILKHACNTRGYKPKINDNLYDPACFGNNRKADIEYTIDGTDFNSVNLVNEVVNNSVLKSVDVFDSFSANHYIEGEDEIAFIPQGLSIIEKLAINIKKIENELNLELSSPALERFEYTLLEVSDFTKAKIFLNNLNSETTLDELRAEAIWNSTKNSRVEKLNKEIDKLKGTDPKKNLKSNEEKIKRFEILQKKFQALENNLTGQILNDLKNILNNLVTTSKALKESSDKAFSELPIEGVGNNSWKVLWESARKFYNESTETKNFPEINEGSNCPLCLQNLNEDAKNRFTSFEEFVKNDIQKTYDEASDKFYLAIENLNKLDFSFEQQEPTTLELNELFEDYSQNQKQYLELLTKQKDNLIDIFNSKKIVETINSIDIENTPKKLIQEVIRTLKETNEKLKVQSIEEDLKPLNKELNQLEGEKKIFDFKPKLAREIFRQKK